MTQFDLFQQQKIKETSMENVAHSFNPQLKIARTIAIHLAQTKGRVSIETVRDAMTAGGIYFKSGNWMGSIFKGKEWIKVGTEPARHEASHGRDVKVWMLKEMYDRSAA